MSKDIANDIIYDFNTEKFIRFFREKNRSFAPIKEELTQYDSEDFKNGLKLGEIKFRDAEHLLICIFEVTQPLTERSGKKAQYEKARKILIDKQSDAGIFIFYDSNGSFRFSLIYTNYLGRKRDWNNFRRFTYFVSKKFTNKTFLKRIGEGDFSSLEKIKDAFSVEKVTKEFYRDISYWYHWSIRETQFPKNAEEEKNGRNIAVIRLITRLIFIWFMRELGLVTNNLFDKDKIKDYLKDLTPSKTTYYKAILQNLFFATLNTKIKDRKFRFSNSFQGRNVHYLDPSIYRYEDYFNNREDMLDIFKEIPFLNGGLFDCLDRRGTEDEKNSEIRIDGFSDKEVGVKVPNFLFFSDETDVDLNNDYGTKNKTYKTQGLIKILSAYNFTIDENNPDDQEVALDPELLGKVFENLLASFNPETSSTARKATGSYYTPREIVDYMVTQSLKKYFNTHLKDVEGFDKKLDELFATDNENNPFVEQDTKNIVSLIDALRIVDPAVGSGAFPMGILNKLVFILSKLDPENSLWKEAQINAVEQNVPDPVIKQDLINQIEKKFSEKYSDSDYGRKLYLIQKCIYGVDIQQIAVEIAKLRFFISLLVDERIDKSKENWGIESLPNLDFKIMQGNSLVEEYEGIKLFDEKLMTSTPFEQIQIQGLEERVSELARESVTLHNAGKLTRDIKRELELQMKGAKNSLKKLTKLHSTEKDQGELNFRSDGKKKGEELKRLHNNYFASTQKREKDALKKKIEVLEWEFIEATLKEQNKESAIREIEKFKKSNIKPFFLWKLNFSEVFQEGGGFDVVIANPPYLGERGNKILFREVKATGFGRKYYKRKMDYFYFFFHKALSVAKKRATVSFITTNYYITADGAINLRSDLYSRAIIHNLINFNELKLFDSATGQHNMITILEKGTNREFSSNNCITKICGNNRDEILKNILSWRDEKTDYFVVKQKNLYDGENKYIRLSNEVSSKKNNKLNSILSKIRKDSVPLVNLKNINQGMLSGVDKVTSRHCNLFNISDDQKGNGVFVLSNKEIKELNLNDNERIIIKPYYKNSDIFRYFTNSKENTKNLIYATRDLNLDDYPHIKKHFFRYERIIKARSKDRGEMQAAMKIGKWWVIFAARAGVDFEGPKIVCPQRSPKNTFGYNDDVWYGGTDIYIITNTTNNSIELKYILSLLNSKLFYVWLYYKGKRKGELLELLYKPLSEIPIKNISKPEQIPFIKMVDQILTITKDTDYLNNSAKKTKVKELEKRIDQLVYKLYGLTSEEIKIVEGEK